MPNWCQNGITIRGKREDILDFLDKFKGQRALYKHDPFSKPATDGVKAQKKPERVYSFNALCPVPEDVLAVGFDGNYRGRELKEILEKYGLNRHKHDTLSAFLGFKIRQIVGFLRDQKISQRKYMVSSFERLTEDRVNELTRRINKIGKNGCGRKYPKCDRQRDRERATELLSSIITVPDGNNWQRENWGTKWDCDLTEHEVDEEFVRRCEPGSSDVELYVDTMTAWSPPLAFFSHISPMFPDLSFTVVYSEPGCNYSGVMEIKDGEVLRDDCGSYGTYGDTFGFEEEAL